MKKIEKNQVVSDLRSIFESYDFVVVARNTGMTVKSAHTLRRKIRNATAGYLVTKNTLAKIAMVDTNSAELGQFMSGPTSLAYSNDPVALSKVLVEFAKVDGKMEICAAVMQGRLIEKTGVEALASLPPLDMLRASIIAAINASAAKIVGVLKAPASQIVRVLNAHSTKNQ